MIHPQTLILKLQPGSNMAIVLFALASFGGIPLTAQEEPESHQVDLVLHYTFDEHVDGRTGKTISNALGDHHPGEPNRATFVEVEKSGMALKVRKNNEKSGYVETADHEDLNAANFTVAAWINLDQTNSNGSVVCKHDWIDAGYRGYVLRCYSGERLNFTVGAQGWIAAVGETPLPAHEWIHVAGAFDGTNITVYLNGRLDGTRIVETPYTPSPLPLRIGHAAFALDKHRKFDGKIDDVMIWKRKLSEQEIRTVYEAQKDSKPAPLTAGDIAGVIENLGSKKYKTRMQAQQKLIAIGREVLPLLETYLDSDDPEIVGRIRQVEETIKNEAGK